MKTVIIALTERGLSTGERLQQHLPEAELLYRPKPFAETVQQAFKTAERLLFICATGIVVRTLAPVIADKYQDPAVLVLDESGRFVISLLSGHEGGANQWATEVAELLGAQPVLTTAKPYTEPVYVAGMGCERGCPVDHLETHLRKCLAEQHLDVHQLAAISSIDIKHDEVGLIELAARLGVPFICYSAEQLGEVEEQLVSRSEYVFNTVGVYGVAESAALYHGAQLAGQPAELILAKQKTPKATCALARGYRGQAE